MLATVVLGVLCLPSASFSQGSVPSGVDVHKKLEECLSTKTSYEARTCYAQLEVLKAQQPAKKVTYDKFRDVTTVWLKDRLELRIGAGDLGQLTFTPAYSCTGDSSVCRPHDVTLVFTAVSDEWRFIKSDRQLTLLLDGQRMPVGQLDWDGHTADSGYSDIGLQTFEVMAISLPTKTFETILTAKDIEGQLGQRTFTIAGEYINTMKAVFIFPPEPIAPAAPKAPVKKHVPTPLKHN